MEWSSRVWCIHTDLLSTMSTEHRAGYFWSVCCSSLVQKYKMFKTMPVRISVFFSITKLRTLKKKKFTSWNRSGLFSLKIDHCVAFVQDSKMWFCYGKKRTKFEQAFVWRRCTFYIFGQLPQTDQKFSQLSGTVDSRSVCVHHTLDDHSIQIHVKNPELFL